MPYDNTIGTDLGALHLLTHDPHNSSVVIPCYRERNRGRETLMSPSQLSIQEAVGLALDPAQK